MKKIHAWIVLAVASLAAACAGAPSSQAPGRAGQTPDLSGHWVLTTQSQMGAQGARMIVHQTGNALAGTITSETGSVDYTGSVRGSAVAFDFIIDVQGTELRLDYTGTVDGDTMKGKAVFGQFGEGTFTAERK